MSPTSYQLLYPAISYIQFFITGFLPTSKLVPETGVEPVRSVRIAGF